MRDTAKDTDRISEIWWWIHNNIPGEPRDDADIQDVAIRLLRERGEALARLEAVQRRLAVLRQEARDDFFAAIGAVADAMDIAANGPNKPRHRRSLHAVAVPMSEILKAKALCEASDAACEEGAAKEGG